MVHLTGMKIATTTKTAITTTATTAITISTIIITTEKGNTL